MRLLLLSIFLFSYLLFSQEIQPKNILVLHSYHKSMSWVTNIDKAIEDILKPKQNNHIMHIEYMDTKRVYNKKYLNDLKNFYILKYKNIKFDLILTSDDNAYDFLREYRNEIFGKVPVIFTGVNNFKNHQITNLSNFTGVTEGIDAKNTIRIATKLFPNSNDIFIINDYTKTGKAWKEKIKKQLKGINKNITYSKNIPFAELKEQLSQLKKNTIVLLGVYFKDKNDVYFTYESIGTALSQSSNSPVFCLLEFNVKNGVIGGSLISGYSQGEAMAHIANEVLTGVETKNIPIKMTDTNKFIFDAIALNTYNIKITDLPENSIILNKKISFYEKHKLVILNSIFIILFLLVIITFLLINIKKRKEIQEQLLISEKEIKRINKSLEKNVESKTKKIKTQNALKKLYLDTADVLLIVLNQKGEVTMLNKKGCELLAVKEKDILGKNWFELNFLPEDMKQTQKRHFLKIMAGKAPFQNGHYEHSLISTTKKEMLFTWTNTLLKVDDEIIGTISSALDVTEKKEQEKILFMQSKITAIEEILNNIAHHWRQPLASIAGQLATMKLSVELEEEIPNEEMLTYVNNIYIQCEYLSNTIDNFRNIFMADTMTIETINLKSTISKIERLIEDSFLDNKIKIIKNLQDCEIKINESTFIDALLNIFNNAKDVIILNNLDEENRFLFIDLKKDEKGIKLSIFDNAGGIKEEIIDKIFEPYYTTKHKSKGTGIGLYMTNQIITKHLHGSILADNIEYPYKDKIHKGAIFTIVLPY